MPSSSYQARHFQNQPSYILSVLRNVAHWMHGSRSRKTRSTVTTALPAPHCSPFSLFCVFHSRALSHALARAPPCCSHSHVIVLNAHCFPMYLTSFDRHLETLVSTSCLQVSPHVLCSVDTSLNTCLSPALPVEPSSSLAAQRPARRSCLSRLSSPLRSTPSRNRGL